MANSTRLNYKFPFIINEIILYMEISNFNYKLALMLIDLLTKHLINK